MPKVSASTLESLRKTLAEDATLDLNFLFLSVAACLIATCGLLLDSPAVIIGAMIVAPLMLPLRGLALGALEGDIDLFQRSGLCISAGTVVAVGLSLAIGSIADIPATEFNGEILSRTQPNLVDLAIALTAGAVGGFAKIRPKISDALAGTAVAVALMPPLCVVGLSLSQGSWVAARGSFLLYLTNLLGIVLACMVVFVWGGYYVENSRITRAFSYTLLLTAPIVVPLSISLAQLLRQVQLQSTLRSILVNQTITVGQQVELLGTRVEWQPRPVHVYLQVRARPSAPVTPKQVFEVEKLVEERLGQRFILVFQVENFDEVRSENLFELTVPMPIERRMQDRKDSNDWDKVKKGEVAPETLEPSDGEPASEALTGDENERETLEIPELSEDSIEPTEPLDVTP